ncbi:3'-5' exonuclease [Patescibacteria group bacterium]|nr:MAG: 3'-5' exonuclease [Patescibacteria group bacterium]
MIVLDVETTGTDLAKNSLVSIGAVEFSHPEAQFYEECRIWDGAHIDPVALERNGFSEEQIKDARKQSEGEMAANFLKWLGERDDMVILGHNVDFDVSFVKAAAQRSGISTPLSKRIVDLHSVTFYHMLRRGVAPPLENRKSNLDSDKVMEYVGIPTESKPHNGLNGAIWEAEAFQRLIYDRALFPEFCKLLIPWL